MPAIAALFVAALTAGCENAPVGPKIFPVVGKVLVDGQPAHRAQVLFHPVNPIAAPEGMTIQPFAVVEPDGTFRPSTQLTADGAPAGEYRVTIVWPEIRIDQGEEIEGPDRLAGAYARASETQLSVSVHPGQNELPPFELKSR
jgi:hypothetical protein